MAQSRNTIGGMQERGLPRPSPLAQQEVMGSVSPPPRQPQAQPALPPFDPDSDSYDFVIEDVLNSRAPLPPESKPIEFQGPEVVVEGANQSWVWHDEEEDQQTGAIRPPGYYAHSGTVTNDLDLLGDDLAQKVREKWPGKEVFLMLKGRKHYSWDQGVAGEEARGYKVVKGPGGRYFSVPESAEGQRLQSNGPTSPARRR